MLRIWQKTEKQKLEPVGMGTEIGRASCRERV